LGNRPLVGAFATVAIHLGMLGHGSLWGGGDRDLAILREIEGAATLGAEGIRWNLTSSVSRWYGFPRYVNRLPTLDAYFGRVDRLDGMLDGRWQGQELDGGVLRGGLLSPARIPFQTRMIEEVVRREGFGDDDVPDLLFINYKLIDEIGHVFTMNSPEMADSVRAQDADLPRLIRILDQEVGRGQWVLALTADHGHTPDPDVTGASVISPTRVADVVQAEFDRDGDEVPVVDYVQPTHVFVNEEELREQGFSLNDVAAYLLTVTKEHVGSDTWPVAASDLDEPAFLAAYPSSLLEELSCVREAVG
jgi:hypothetical protein